MTKNKKHAGLAAPTMKKKKNGSNIKSFRGGADMRENHRIPIQLLVDYRADGHYLFDFCRDLGAGGVFIQTTKPLDLGSHIDLTFTIPDSKETLMAKGSVIWVQPVMKGRPELTPGMGVQFTGFTAEQRKLLEDFVTRYQSAATETPLKSAS